jgi:hypothetical protein
VKVLSARPVKFPYMKKMYHKNIQKGFLLYAFDIKDYLSYGQKIILIYVEGLHIAV